MPTILLGGDVMLGRLFNKLYQKQPNLPKNHPWGNLIPILNNPNNSATIINLETTITNSKDKWPNKVFNYQMNSNLKSLLPPAKIKFCSLANNHILDFKEKGLKDTQTALGSLGIQFAGAGSNLSEAMKPTFLTLNTETSNQIKIGFLSAADHYPYWAATPNSAGIWYIPIRNGNNPFWQHAIRQIREVKKQCDLLIFSLHWNYNYVDQIHPNFQKFAHLLIKNGVDIIHGHSPHHLLKIEKYQGGIIFYSLGGLIDDYAISPKYRNDLGCLAQITITKTNRNQKPIKVNLDGIYPTRISKLQVNLAESAKDLKFIKNGLGKNIKFLI